MYGRAKLALLCARVLHVARAEALKQGDDGNLLLAA